MSNTIELAKSFVPKLDECYRLASLTSVLDGAPELAKQGANANELIIPMMSMDGLADYSRNGGYERLPPGSAGRSLFSMPSASEDNRQGYGSSGSLLPETVPPGISAGAWAFLPFPAVSSPHRKARSPVPVVRRLLSFPAHTGRRQNQSHPHPHRSRSSGNAYPASCLGFYRDGTGSKRSFWVWGYSGMAVVCSAALWAFCVSRARTAALSKSSPSFRAVIGFVLSGVR